MLDVEATFCWLVTCFSSVGAVTMPLLSDVECPRACAENFCPSSPTGISRLRCSAGHVSIRLRLKDSRHQMVRKAQIDVHTCGPNVWQMISENVACLSLTHKTETHGGLVFADRPHSPHLAWCYQTHRMGHGQHPNLKIDMIGWIDGQMENIWILRWLRILFCVFNHDSRQQWFNNDSPPIRRYTII